MESKSGQKGSKHAASWSRTRGVASDLRRSISAFAAIVVCSAVGTASDWYVDALNGSNANSGSSPTHAWRTITYALAATPAATPGGTQVIHVAPGVYDAALGESFPLLPRDAFQLVGDQGKSVTQVDAGGTSQVVRAWYDHFGGNYVGPLTTIRGLTISNGGVGVDVQCQTAVQTLTLEDLRITGMSSAGVRSYTGCVWGCGLVNLSLSGVEISGCSIGIDFEEDSLYTNAATLELKDCAIEGNATVGIEQYTHSGATTLACERTRISQNGAQGLLVVHDAAVFGNLTQATLSDCLIDRNGGGGVRGTTQAPSTTGLLGGIVIDLSRCTLADNSVAGLDVFRTVGSYLSCQAALHGTLLFGNFDDILDNPANPSISAADFCDVGDGDFAGSNGNFSSNPLFVDAANGDYRVKWSSPCIESGDPATPIGVADLAGNARPIDGDLDTIERFDVGAYEFAPLFMKSTGEIGTPLAFELWGPQGAATTLYFARRPLVAGQSTPFGELDLDPTAMHVFRTTTVGSGPPKTITRQIPNSVALIGKVFSFQALTDCAAAPQAKAYTNAFQLTIVL